MRKIHFMLSVVMLTFYRPGAAQRRNSAFGRGGDRKMMHIRKNLMAGVICLSLVILPGSLPAQNPPDPPAGNDQEVVALLKEQNSQLSRDLRRIQREIAALRADLDKPGMKEVFAGIGYIFGLFGVAAFVAARRKK